MLLAVGDPRKIEKADKLLVMRKFKQLGVLAAVASLASLNVSAAVPASVTTAITDVETAGASVFAALVIVAMPFILFKLVRKIRG